MLVGGFFVFVIWDVLEIVFLGGFGDLGFCVRFEVSSWVVGVFGWVGYKKYKWGFWCCIVIFGLEFSLWIRLVVCVSNGICCSSV